jgi:hypothetical protein
MSGELLAVSSWTASRTTHVSTKAARPPINQPARAIVRRCRSDRRRGKAGPRLTVATAAPASPWRKGPEE